MPKQSATPGGKGQTLRVLSHPPVLAIAVLCFFVFMLEGAMLDWSAVFMTSDRGMSASLAGFGYTLYSITVTLGRLSGERQNQYLMLYEAENTESYARYIDGNGEQTEQARTFWRDHPAGVELINIWKTFATFGELPTIFSTYRQLAENEHS